MHCFHPCISSTPDGYLIGYSIPNALLPKRLALIRWALRRGNELNHLIGLSSIAIHFRCDLLHTPFPLTLMGVTVWRATKRRIQDFWLHYGNLKFITTGYWGIALNTLPFVIHFLVNATIWVHRTLLSRKHFSKLFKTDSPQSEATPLSPFMPLTPAASRLMGPGVDKSKLIQKGDFFLSHCQNRTQIPSLPHLRAPRHEPCIQIQAATMNPIMWTAYSKLSGDQKKKNGRVTVLIKNYRKQKLLIVGAERGEEKGR